MRVWEGLVLIGTIVFGLIAVAGLIQVQRRMKARDRLRSELARVVADLGAEDAGPSRSDTTDDAGETP